MIAASLLWRHRLRQIAPTIVLAARVLAVSVMALLGYSEPKPTILGIAVLIAAAVYAVACERETTAVSLDM